MPLQAPPIDARSYQQLLDEALARIPVHNPGWTNFNPADPGVTLLEVFAFLTESLLYRANQIPERNRMRFLQLLGVPMLPGAAARGIVAIERKTGPAEVETLHAGVEMLAGDVAFRSERGLDVLPLEARFFTKQRVPDADGTLQRRYDLLYASYLGEAGATPTELQLYRTVPFENSGEGQGLDLAADTIDGCLWLALCRRPGDVQAGPTPAELRRRMAGRTLSLGLVPSLASEPRVLPPVGATAGVAAAAARWVFELPDRPHLLGAEQLPVDRWRAIDARELGDVLASPGVVELALPSDPDELVCWQDLDPLEQGTGAFPPALDDEALEQRVLTWLRIRPQPAGAVRLMWAGINAVMVAQRERIAFEPLADGTGEPDQSRTLAHPPLVPGSLTLTVTPPDEAEQTWQAVDDLLLAAAEVPVGDLRQPPGAAASTSTLGAAAESYTVDAESGLIRFGDGFRGRRPAAGARLRASYDHSRGRLGNVRAAAISSAPSLPQGCTVSNPVRTWGGVDAEALADAERRVPQFLQHRDRLVTQADFEAIARQTPGIDLARVEVQSAFHPDLEPDAPGNAPGVVTLMLVPRHDPLHPLSPEPDRLFIDAVCRHLEPRRLVTTELVLRGPQYRLLWVTAGIEVTGDGRSPAEVREDVKRRLLEFLSPLEAGGFAGWPLRKPVAALELAAVASRVEGVRLVQGVRLIAAGGAETDTLRLQGLELPRVAGIAVQIGGAADPALLRGGGGGAAESGEASTAPAAPRLVPVPVVPQEC